MLLVSVMLPLSTAFAECISPAGPAGRIDFFSSADERVFKYCDGADWVPWAGEPVAGIPAPQYSSSGGNDFWTAGSGDSIYYNSGTPQVGISKTDPGVALDVVGDIDYTGIITDVSDRRQKENIKPLERSLDNIAALNGYSFTMKNDDAGAVEYGLIAQEVEPVFPELVKTKDDGLKTLNTIGMIAPLVEAMKELKAENEALRARLETLEAAAEPAAETP